jgi:hypothetical protein
VTRRTKFHVTLSRMNFFFFFFFFNLQVNLPSFITTNTQKMSDQAEDDAVYNLLVDDSTGDLRPKVEKVEFSLRASNSKKKI